LEGIQALGREGSAQVKEEEEEEEEEKARVLSALAWHT